ncbi:hypothetical protein ACFL36_01430 [Thermodesulfobacteriota bacterium]
MDKLLQTTGAIAGIGGLSLGVFIILFREIIRKQIFPTLTKKQAYRLIIILSILIWSLSIIGIIAWLINSGKIEKSLHSEIYKVNIVGYPTSVNSEAKVQPNQLIVKLDCGENVQQLINLNFPVEKTFIWSPKLCEDVIVSIAVGNLTLEKSFSGPFGFPEFLREFTEGHRTYRRYEFNETEKEGLKSLGIEFLTVHFLFKGDTQKVIEYLSD